MLRLANAARVLFDFGGKPTESIDFGEEATGAVTVLVAVPPRESGGGMEAREEVDMAAMGR